MEENIMQDARISSAPRKRPEIVRILIYVGIMLGVNLALSIPYNLAYNALVQGLLFNGGMSISVFNIVTFFFNHMHTYGLCIVEGILFRRLVFRSKFNAFLPILVMCGLNDVSSFIRTLIGMVVNANALTGQQYTAILNTMSIVSLITVATVGYVIMRCGFYKRTLDTLVKPREPLAVTGYLSATEEGA